MTKMTAFYNEQLYHDLSRAFQYQLLGNTSGWMLLCTYPVCDFPMGIWLVRVETSCKPSSAFVLVCYGISNILRMLLVMLIYSGSFSDTKCFGDHNVPPPTGFRLSPADFQPSLAIMKELYVYCQGLNLTVCQLKTNSAFGSHTYSPGLVATMGNWWQVVLAHTVCYIFQMEFVQLPCWPATQAVN